MHTAQIVSVIVVTCAAEDYLSFSLDSIKEQTYPPLEIIVINNNPAFNFSQAFSKRYVGITVYSNPANLFNKEQKEQCQNSLSPYI